MQSSTPQTTQHTNESLSNNIGYELEARDMANENAVLRRLLTEEKQARKAAEEMQARYTYYSCTHSPYRNLNQVS